MSTNLNAEALPSHTWLERARCATIGLAIHSGILLMCLLTANPLLKRQVPIFVGILIASMLADVIVTLCFFYGFQKKDRWFFVPIMIKQGVEAIIRSLFLVIFTYELLFKDLYDPQSFYGPFDDSFGAVLAYVFLLPFNVISIFCFMKAFIALRPSSPIYVPLSGSSTRMELKALQSHLWVERARCVAIGFSIYEAIFLLCLVTENPLLKDSECFSMSDSIFTTVLYVFCLTCCFRGLRKQGFYEFWLLPITLAEAIQAIIRTGMIIELIAKTSSASEDICCGIYQFRAFLLPLNIIALYCFKKILCSDDGGHCSCVLECV